MIGKYWLADSNFAKICDMVAKNDLICFTGAGISTTLKLKSGETAPDWKKLLTALSRSIDELSESEKNDLDVLLAGNPSGDRLIEASSILYNKDKDKFFNVLQRSVTLEEGETSETHRAILALRPRGILTYNYDNGHENSIQELPASVKREYAPETVLPSDSEKIRELLKGNLSKPFLLKAHGTFDKRETMVLTSESYRDLFNRYPYYKAFIQHIFTNYQLLVVGFGLSDPDFDILLQNMFSVFGSPIQEHVVIKHRRQKSPKDTLYRLRYGLNFLYVEDFGDIPQILRDASCHAGEVLNTILQDCVSPEIVTRGKAHENIRGLSVMGKKCLADILKARIEKNLAEEPEEHYSNNTENSELVYSYGVIAASAKDKAYKEFLITVVDRSCFSEPVAHALVNLRDLMDVDDLPKIEEWLKRFEVNHFIEDRDNPDENNRVHKYCEAIYYLVRAKYNVK